MKYTLYMYPNWNFEIFRSDVKYYLFMWKRKETSF